MYLVTLFASLLIFSAVTFTFLNSRYFSLFHPFTFYSLFHGLVFVIRPLLSQWLHYELVYQVYEFTPSIEDKITVIVAANLGFLAFGFFSMRQGAIEMRFARDPLLTAERNRLARFFVWVLVVCGPIAAWSLQSNFVAASNYAVLDTLATDRATGVIYNTKGSGYFYEAQMMLVTLTAVLAWLFRFRLISLIPLFVFVIYRAATGGRGPFVTALIATGLLYLFDQRRRFPTLKMLATLAAAGLMFTAVGQDRGQSVRALLGEQVDSRRSGENDLRFMEGMDFANMEFFEFIVYVVPQRSHTYGYFNDVLQLFTEPVPRALWPGKPFGAPFERIRMYDYGFPVGYTRSLPGEGWYSLGWLGVVIWCGLWGYGLGAIYRKFVESEQNAFQVAAYMVFLPIMIVAYRDGLIVTVFRQGIFFMAPILLWIAITRFFNVPLARDIRTLLARKQRREALLALPAPDASSAAVRSAPDPDRHLPPAVRRRRQALRASEPGQPV